MGTVTEYTFPQPYSISLNIWAKKSYIIANIFCKRCRKRMDKNFNVVEATISEIHSAMESGLITSRELVQVYLDRIETYDRNGPEINSIITINSDAKTQAQKLDETYKKNGLSGPLHGIPVLLKDQAMTADLKTTLGSIAFSDYIPKEDATIVSRLRGAGAIILCKTNLPDWAAGDAGYSSVAGQTKNPYDLERDPGGSSAGTAAAVAANFATVGIGEDTGGSIRVPSSHCNLFGLRATTGLISRDGLSPLLTRQDTAGPMARTVEDLTRLLTVIQGYDPADSYTSVNAMIESGNFLESLTSNSINNARIGVLRQGFGANEEPDCKDVNKLVESSLELMEGAGAELVDPVSIENLDNQLNNSWLYGLASKSDINTFLSNLDRPPIDSFEELYESGDYYEGLPVIEEIASGPTNPSENIEYWQCIGAQDQLRRNILQKFAEHNLDAIAFPDVKIPARPYKYLRTVEYEDRKLLTNTYIASQSSCPAISMPAGVTKDGLPVGIELMGVPFSERRLLSLAADYERIADNRRSPTNTPPLQSE